MLRDISEVACRSNKVVVIVENGEPVVRWCRAASSRSRSPGGAPTRWPGKMTAMSLSDRWDADPRRLAIMLPGAGYGPDMPVLYWTAKTLYTAAWTIRRVRWDESASRPKDGAGWVRRVHDVTDGVLAEEATAGDVLLVGKSLGSLAIRYAAEHEIHGIWLTPLISASHEAGLRDQLGDLPHSLLVGGTADSSWDGAFARDSGHDVCEIAGGDHALEVPGNPGASVDALKLMVTAIQSYVETWAVA